MKRVTTHTFWICVLPIVAGLTCRLLWHASSTETGLETVSFHWRDATWGWIAGNREPIYSQPPSMQAQFWLDEVARVLSREGNNAALAMGAALVLDSPSRGYLNKYLVDLESIAGVGVFPQWDTAGLDAFEDAFETQCKERCLELAAKATELDPANVNWWRLRAMLLWPHPVLSRVDSPRTDHWPEILQAASQHDPDNALYDYIAAELYWKSSARLELQGLEEKFVVHDAPRFNLGTSHFERGLQKPLLIMDADWLSVMGMFLSNTSVPILDHERVVNSRLIHARHVSLLLALCRLQNNRSDLLMPEGDVRGALARLTESLVMLDQFMSVEAFLKHDSSAAALCVIVYAQINELVKEQPDKFLPEEIEKYAALEETALLSQQVVWDAGAVLMAKQRPKSLSGMLDHGTAPSIGGFVVWLAPSLTVVLLLAGLLAMGLSRHGDGNEVSRLGVVEHALSLTAALICTFVVLGLAPVGIVPARVQAWTITAAIATAVIWTLCVWLRRRNFQFSLLAILISVLACSVLFRSIAAARPKLESFAQIPFDLAIPPLAWNGLSSNVLEAILRQTDPGWLFPFAQWTLYFGPYWTLAMWAAVAAGLLRPKRGPRAEIEANAICCRQFFGSWTRSVGRAFLTSAVILTVLYLLLAPVAVTEVERQFQLKMAFARQPREHWSALDEAVDQVRSDEQLMKRLRATVATKVDQRNSMPDE